MFYVLRLFIMFYEEEAIHKKSHKSRGWGVKLPLLNNQNIKKLVTFFMNGP